MSLMMREAVEKIKADIHAIVRECGEDFDYSSVLVGWQCGFEPLFVAVHSYLDVRLTDEEAKDLAKDYLEEIGWFDGSNRSHESNYVISDNG